MNATINQNFALQLPRNLAGNILWFLANLIIGLLLVPYFVSTLGVAAYGLIPLATSVTGYAAIIVQSLNSAVTRYLTVELQQEDLTAANRTFNTAFFGLSAIILLMVPIVVAVAFYIPTIFDVPSGQESGATLLFLGVCFALLVRLWSGNYTVQLFAYNRLDLQNLINLTNLIVQTGLIVLLFTLRGPDLAFVGGAYLAGAALSSVLSIILAKRVCNHLKVSLRCFDRSRVRDLCRMGWWLVIDQAGTLLLLQIDLIIVNILFGATSAGNYAIAFQWAILLRAIAGTFSGVLAPMVLTYYALKQKETLIKLTTAAVKFMGLAMALPTGLICGFAPQLLSIWVGPEYENLALLMILLTAPLAVNLTVLPLFPVNVAYNRVRIPGIVTILFGVSNVILAILLSLTTGWGYYGVAIAGVIVLTIRHLLFVPWYTARVLHTQMTRYVKSIIPGFLSVLLIAGGAGLSAALFPINSLVSLSVAVLIISIIFGVTLGKFGISPIEKQFFNSYLPLKWRNCR